jgi:hypothetical protein
MKTALACERLLLPAPYHERRFPSTKNDTNSPAYMKNNSHRIYGPKPLHLELHRSRSMRPATNARQVATSISGHKTENLYRRYDIVAERDFSDAATRLDQFFGQMKAESKAAHSGDVKPLGTLSGTPENSAPAEPKEPRSEPEPNP